MSDTFSTRHLSAIFSQTPVRQLDPSNRVVVFSDLHMGNGGRNDDFLHNGSMFAEILEEYYLASGYRLVLNGDVEELQRFRLEDIRRRWTNVYRVFGEFRERGRMDRLIGNHDMGLKRLASHDRRPADALRYEYNGNHLFILHGHQTSVLFERFNPLVGLGLRYVANPLGFGNYAVAEDSRKRFKTERNAYEFAASGGLLILMGHTHRPLFESMSKVDSLRFDIERLCRAYPDADPEEQGRIREKVANEKRELVRASDTRRLRGASSLYNDRLLIPCTFNSGTIIGKRGFTGLEMRDGSIALVHWFDATRSSKYLDTHEHEITPLQGTSFHRVILASESLDYIFARITLLAGS